MNTKTRCLSAALAGCTILLASCAPQVTPTRVPVSSTPSSSPTERSLSGAVYEEVNAYRGAVGRGHIERDPQLDRMAREHSEYMMTHRGTFTLHKGGMVSHYGFDGRALYAQRAMNMTSVAENVAAGPWAGKGGPASMVDAWKHSPGHDFNMRGQWNATGVGTAVDKDGTVFATQIFGSRSSSLMSMTDQLRGY